MICLLMQEIHECLDSSKDSERFYSETGIDVEELFQDVCHNMFDPRTSEIECQDDAGKLIFVTTYLRKNYKTHTKCSLCIIFIKDFGESVIFCLLCMKCIAYKIIFK